MRIVPVYFIKRRCLFPATRLQIPWPRVVLTWLALSKNILSTHNTWICELITTLAATDRRPKWPSAGIFCFLPKYILLSQPQVHALTLHWIPTLFPFQSAISEQKRARIRCQPAGVAYNSFYHFYFILFFLQRNLSWFPVTLSEINAQRGKGRIVVSHT